MVRISKIELVSGNKKQSFKIEHAERLLGMANNGGWKIANDKYQFVNGSISIVKKK